MTEDPLVARRVAALTMDYVAHALRGLAEIYGDGRTGLIVQASVAANREPRPCPEWRHRVSLALTRCCRTKS